MQSAPRRRTFSTLGYPNEHIKKKKKIMYVCMYVCITIDFAYVISTLLLVYSIYLSKQPKSRPLQTTISVRVSLAIRGRKHLE